MAHRYADQHRRDMKAMAAIAEVDHGTVRGFTLVLYLDTNEYSVITDACCVRHALSDLGRLVEYRAPRLAPCSAET